MSRWVAASSLLGMSASWLVSAHRGESQIFICWLSLLRPDCDYGAMGQWQRLLLVVVATSRCSSSLERGWQEQVSHTPSSDGVHEVSVRLSLEDVYRGKQLDASIVVDTQCPRCSGSGHEAGPGGAMWECTECGGTGRSKDNQQIKIVIPRGTRDGGTAMVPTGSGKVLRVRVQTTPHPQFTRSGAADEDLLVTLPLSEEAAEGGYEGKEVRLLDGSVLVLARAGRSGFHDEVLLPGLGMPLLLNEMLNGALIVRFALDGGASEASFSRFGHAAASHLSAAVYPTIQWLGTSEKTMANVATVAGQMSDGEHVAAGLSFEMTAGVGASGMHVAMVGSNAKWCFEERGWLVSWEALIAPLPPADSPLCLSTDCRQAPVRPGLRLLLLRAAVNSNEEENWNVAAMSPGMSAHNRSQARHMMLLLGKEDDGGEDNRIVAEAGDCVGLLFEPGGGSTAGWTVPTDSRTASIACADMGTARDTDDFQCNESDKSYFLRVGWLPDSGGGDRTVPRVLCRGCVSACVDAHCRRDCREHCRRDADVAPVPTVDTTGCDVCVAACSDAPCRRECRKHCRANDEK